MRVSILILVLDTLEEEDVIVVYISVDIRRENSWHPPARTPLINSCTHCRRNEGNGRGRKGMKMLLSKAEISLRDSRNSALWPKKEVLQDTNNRRVLVRLRANNTRTLSRGER